MDETFFSMLSMFDRPFPLSQSVGAFVGLSGRTSCRIPEQQRCTHYDSLLKEALCLEHELPKDK